MTTTSSNLPRIGSLVTLRPFSRTMNYVKVESLANEDEVRDFPVGTIALVIDHRVHPDDRTGETAVPVVLVEGFQGWVFNDEWKYKAVRREKRAS
jgi:hypothetical protein